MVLQDYEKKHLKLVRKSAAECTVLLKKDGSFPLAGPCKLAAYGAGIRHTVKGGTGSGEVNSRFSMNVEQGLLRGGFTLTSTPWLDAYDLELASAKEAFVERIRQEAKAAHQNIFMYSMGKAMPQPDFTYPLDQDGEAAIYVLTRDSGEGADRTVIQGDVKLTDAEIRDILALNKMYEKFMLVLNVGGVVDLSPVQEVKNILLLSQLGVVTGYVLSDILLGKAYPSGKVATTWAKWGDYCVAGDFGDPDETHYNEGIYVGYRYFDSVGKKALYPFGFGLSYTEFSIANAAASVAGSKVTVTAEVENIGSLAGKEVVQVYVSVPEGKLDQPYQSLAGWAKTKELKPGEKEQVSVTLSMEELASYDTEAAGYILEAGAYVVRVGNSSVDTVPAAILDLDQTVMTLKTRNCLGTPDFEDLTIRRECEALPLEVPHLTLLAADLSQEEVSYDPDYAVDPRVEALTDEELVYLLIGAFDPKGGFLSVIGDASKNVPGAAGETTSILRTHGFKTMVMADGPAGLRLTRDYYKDSKGKIHGLGVGMLPESMMQFLDDKTRFAMNLISGSGKIPKGVDVQHQYATAIPIGTALAQSFNTEMEEALGDLVGYEMELMGVHLWLAPAQNIHRTILCGRNFEYYSEDPLVSGRVAAAITRGVQKHEGRGTTIKHYAANNAETNRYGNNSQVSERAMREIYLKGFGICVRESQPHAVMTSYNLLNGTHTAEHRGLTEDILRCEYGYQGIVMTDWVVSMISDASAKHRNSIAAEVVKAGGDIFMPGCKGDYKSVLDALKDGSLSRRQAQVNATRMVKMGDLLVK